MPNKRNSIIWALLLLLAGAGAFAFRVPKLDMRPLHTDEAVHAFKLGEILDNVHKTPFSEMFDEPLYVYNPKEYHGPTPYFFSLPFVYASGARTYAEMKDSVSMRIVSVWFGVGLVLLMLLFRDALGQRAAFCAGLFTAISPVMVFYSRYYIQEMILVFFTAGAIVAGWRYTRSHRLGWALMVGLCLGMMHATKETCVIAYGALFGAGVLTVLWTRVIDRHRIDWRKYFHGWHFALGVTVALVVSAFCLTALLSNPKATLDSIKTYLTYASRAVTGDSSTNGGEIHNHPWYYYLQMLIFFKEGPKFWWSEAFILVLAVVGMGKALVRRGECEANIHLLRYLTFFTLQMTFVYSIIPYKTPWCLLGFYHGMLMMAGVGAIAIYRRLERVDKPWVFIGFLLCVIHLGNQAYDANFRFYAHTRNPWVYAHTSTSFLKLMDRMEALADVHKDGHEMVVPFVALDDDYWPLPWYMRKFPNSGPIYNMDDLKALRPDVIIVKGDDAPLVEAYLESIGQSDNFISETYGLRPDVFMYLYIKQELWDKFMEKRMAQSPVQ